MTTDTKSIPLFPMLPELGEPMDYDEAVTLKRGDRVMMLCGGMGTVDGLEGEPEFAPGAIGTVDSVDVLPPPQNLAITVSIPPGIVNVFDGADFDGKYPFKKIGSQSYRVHLYVAVRVPVNVCGVTRGDLIGAARKAAEEFDSGAFAAQYAGNNASPHPDDDETTAEYAEEIAAAMVDVPDKDGDPEGHYFEDEALWPDRNSGAVHKYLDCSTGHLRPSTRQRIADGECPGPSQYPNEYGAWVHVPSEAEDAANEEGSMPDDLLAVVRYARVRGCCWIKFDRDADRLQCLPWYGGDHGGGGGERGGAPPMSPSAAYTVLAEESDRGLSGYETVSGRYYHTNNFDEVEERVLAWLANFPAADIGVKYNDRQEAQEAGLDEAAVRWFRLDGENLWLRDDPEADGPADRCTHPFGHKWVCSGTAYDGDDESYFGEGRCYCEHCGADGDA